MNRVFNMFADWCGICGGNNSTCREERGVYNVTEYGYNPVVRIPKGATNVDIRQYGFDHKSTDDTYIALRDVDSREYVLNGDFVMSMFQKTIQYGGMTLEYSGSDTIVERVNSSKPLRKDLMVEVLTVGNLNPPQVHYSYVISSLIDFGGTYVWKSREAHKWSHCDRQCQGKQYSSTEVCVAVLEASASEVDEKFCSYLPRQKKLLVKSCNMHCRLLWKEISRTPCSTRCGQGRQKVQYSCAQIMANEPEMVLPDEYCKDIEPRPEEDIFCEGPCQGVKWRYSPWSECSATCGEKGVQRRTVQCVDLLGNKIDEGNCLAMESPIRDRKCNRKSCPVWKTGDWTACSTTCGTGVRERPYWCEMEDLSVNVRFCLNQSVPTHKQNCQEKPCTTWFVGPYSNCSAKCGEGSKTREVYCREERSGQKLESYFCNSNNRPRDKKICMGISPSCEKQQRDDENNLGDEDDRFINPKIRGRFYWKVGRWQKCSKECGRGFQMRPVGCFDYEAKYKDQDQVSSALCMRNVIRPRHRRQCNPHDCLEQKVRWLSGEWSECSTASSVSCVQTRSVSCISAETGSLVESNECRKKLTFEDEPDTERPCENCRGRVRMGLEPQPQSSHVEHESESELSRSSDSWWRKGAWSDCSVTCGGGLKRRTVACIYQYKEASSCDAKKRPPAEISCNTEPCPRWNLGEWGQCDQPCDGGIQLRLVRCRDHLGQTLPDLRCRLDSRPDNSRSCNEHECERKYPKYLWKRSPWSAVSTLLLIISRDCYMALPCNL